MGSHICPELFITICKQTSMIFIVQNFIPVASDLKKSDYGICHSGDSNFLTIYYIGSGLVKGLSLSLYNGPIRVPSPLSHVPPKDRGRSSIRSVVDFWPEMMNISKILVTTVV